MENGNWRCDIGPVPPPRQAGSQRTPVRLRPQNAAAEVLADRLAAALVQREPGRRLPRRSALARRYSVSITEINSAVGELVRRSLIRELPDGQLYRASPAEYLIPVEGIAGLATWLDPMGGEITCQARHVSQRAAPQEVAVMLGAGQESSLSIVQCVWAAQDGPVAISTAYVPQAAAHSLAGDDPDSFQAMLSRIPVTRPGAEPACARAADLELSPAQPSVARVLRLAPGHPTTCVTIRFDDPETGAPAGLTVVTMKPDRFRVVIAAGQQLTAAARPGHLADGLQAHEGSADPVPTAACGW